MDDGHVVKDAPRRDDGAAGLGLFGSAAWDHLANTARRYGPSIAELAEASPQTGTLPKRDEAQEEGAVLTVKDVEKAPPVRLR